MRKTALAAALMVSAAYPALGQSTQHLEEALGTLPEFFLTNPAPFQANFVDIAAITDLLEANGAEDAVQILRRTENAGGLYPVAALHAGGIAAWEERSHIPLADIRYFIGMSEAPYMVSAWGLEDEASVDALVGRLAANGFEPFEDGPALGNGVPMEQNLLERDVSDPWTGPLGQASFIAPKGPVLLQATMPQPIETMIDPGQTVADNPVVSTALAGLEAAVGDGQIVQAMLVSSALGLEALDVVDFILPGQDMAASIEEIQSQIASSQTGIPPYLGGFLIDAQLEQPTAIFALTFANCKIAQEALELIEARWSETMAEIAPGPVSGETVEGSDGMCAASFAITDDENEGLVNRPFMAVLSAIMQRQFSVLQIGMGA